jgi:anti-anti-sigma regulatory factor
MPDSKEGDFKFVLGEKEDVLLVLFYGKITGREVPELEKCLNELKVKTQPIVLMNFRDVDLFLPGAHTFFALFQKTLRGQGKLLGISSLKPDVKTSLVQAGIVREAEIFNNIPDAWKALSPKAKK